MRGVIPILRIGRVLLASIQLELHDAAASAFQEDVLTALARFESRGLVVDITGLDMVDSHVARVLVDTARMARLMGADSVLVGMSPVIAATLVRMGFPMEGVTTALNIEEGLKLFGVNVGAPEDER